MISFKTLTVWEKSHQLTLQIYRESKSFPSDEKFGLTSQLRRASASVPANIAEGCGRGTDPELRRFLEIAMGSASEVCLLYTSPSPRDRQKSRMPSSA